MKIAILLSSYNGENYINKQLESIFMQNCKDEIILCIRDDGSTDDTLNIINFWKNKLNIILFCGNNIGPRDSFKELLVTAPNSDFYCFCDQDDIWHYDKLASAVKILGSYKNNIPLLYFSNISLVDKQGKLIKENRDLFFPQLNYRSLLVKNPAPGCTMMFNHELRLALMKVNFDYFFMHDVVAVEVASIIGKIVYDSKSRVDYRQHSESVTQGHNKIKNLLNKINFWFFQKNISICKQANELLRLFPNNLEKIALEDVCKYRKGLNRFKLAFNRKYRSDDSKCNRSFVIRILFGIA